jgi:cytochrome c553
MIRAAAAWLCALAFASIAQGASGARQEFESVVSMQPDAVHGEHLFVTCATCHGAYGGGTADGRIPAIAGQHLRVLVAQLVDFRHDKRWDALMEHYSDNHNLGDAQDVADVAAYINHLPPVQSPGVGSGEHVSTGSRLYARSCASCHGAAGEGDNTRGYPRLAGQHYGYLLRQMHDAVDGRRPNFSRAHIRRLARFERADFEGVADYLSRAAGREPP